MFVSVEPPTEPSKPRSPFQIRIAVGNPADVQMELLRADNARRGIRSGAAAEDLPPVSLQISLQRTAGIFFARAGQT